MPTHSKDPSEDRRLNDITLKEYIEARLNSLEDSIKKSESLLEVRLSHMNEFREQMECERATYITKDNYDNRHKSLEDKISYVEKLFYVGLGILLTLEVIFRVLK